MKRILNMPREYVELEDCNIIKETEDAFLINYEGEENWIPKSQIFEPNVYQEGDESVSIEITCWIAEQKGID